MAAVDLLQMPPVPDTTFVQGDFTDPAVQELLLEALGGPADLVVSDVSPNRSGHRSHDSARLVALVEDALILSRRCLRPGGTLVAKLLQGEDQPALLRALRTFCAPVKLHKPPSSRKQSAEVFVVASGFDHDRFDGSAWLADGLE